MPYRTAAEVLAQMAPVDAGTAHETLRRYTFRVAEALPIPATVQPATPAETIMVTLDSTFIRSCEDGERHLEVRIGNVETSTGCRQVFGAVAKTDTNLAALIRGNLDAVGRIETTVLTAFTDGCSGLRRILRDAGVDGPPILDWFHLAMRPAAPDADRRQLIIRQPGAHGGEGGDRRGGRAPALAAVERQGQERRDQHRPDLRGHAEVDPTSGTTGARLLIGSAA